MFAKLIRSPNDKCRTICERLNDDDEYGCTSWMWMWFSEKLLPGATWKLPPICNKACSLRNGVNNRIFMEIMKKNVHYQNKLLLYPIHFEISIDLASLVQSQFLCLILLINIIFSFALFEFFWFRIPSFLSIRHNHILTGVTAMCLICPGTIAVPTNRHIGWYGNCLCFLISKNTKR